MRGSVVATVAGAVLLAAAPRCPAAGAEARGKLTTAESPTVAVLAPMNPRRLFVLDTMFPAAQAAKTYVLDGSTGAIEGMFNQAYWPNFGISPDGTELYAVDTYWEKHTRGRRSDYIVVRDARTLDVREDVPLPNGRQIIVSKKNNFDITPDGRYGLTYNLAPETAVTITDLRARRTVGEVAIPGCALIFAQAPHRFSSLCADGAVLTASFDDDGAFTTQRATRVFDAVNDPAFEHSGWDKPHRTLYLVTYHGRVIPVDLDGEKAVPGTPWWLASEQERAEGWLPGGWQVSHVHSATRRLYVLMHQGHYWTEKSSGTEVWEFDAADGRRLQRIRLPEPAQSISVSQDDAPLLYAITDSARILAFRLDTGALLYRTEPVGFTPQLLTVWGN